MNNSIDVIGNENSIYGRKMFMLIHVIIIPNRLTVTMYTSNQFDNLPNDWIFIVCFILSCMNTTRLSGQLFVCFQI